MFKNNILTFLRDIRNNKFINFINIFGLSVGLACAAVLCAIILHFLSFDKFHKNHEYIYQCFCKHTDEGNSYITPTVSYMLGKSLLEKVPEVKNSATVSFPGDYLIISGDKKFIESGIYADSSIFSIFTFPIIAQLSKDVFPDINSLTISETLAKKYFGSSKAALGKILLVIQQKTRMNLVVSGVFKDVPDNSMLRFNFLIPIAQNIKNDPSKENWGYLGFHSYIQIRENTNIGDLKKKVKGFLQHHGANEKDELVLSKFDDFLLHSPGSHDIGMIVIYILILIGAGILIIASVNFINLTTSRGIRKAKEVGIRKVAGANRGSLILKFLTESLVTAMIAAALSLCFAEGIMPIINRSFAGFVKFQIPLNNYVYMAVFLTITVLVGLAAGIIPAFYLSSFSPINTIKGEIVIANKKYLLRKVLLVFQFVISTVMIFASLVIYEQMSFIKTADLGINISQIIKFEVSGGIKDKFEPFKNDLSSLTSIKEFTFSSENPVQMMMSTSSARWDGKPEGMNNFINYMSVNDNFIKTFNIKLISGKDIDSENSNFKGNFLINQKMAELMGKKDPVGEKLSFNGTDGHIIGVVKDFNNANLTSEILPAIMYKDNKTADYCFIRAQDGKLLTTINAVKAIYDKYEKESPFTYSFLDEEFAKQHIIVDIAGTLFDIFSIVAILISCLGLFGLTALIIEQRRKEIGIRKVLGATVVSIISLASRNFIILIITANIIAIPIGYFVCSKFLSVFAYKTNISIWLILMVLSIETILAFITINYHSIKVAISNPVDSLRNE